MSSGEPHGRSCAGQGRAPRGRDERHTTGARPRGLVLLPGGAAPAADGACESRLTIRTFGCFALLRHGQPVETHAWGRRKVREIFLYLVIKHLLEPRQPVTRDELIETFWPDLALHTAESSL